MAFFTDPANLPFSVALAIMLMIAITEGVMTLIGFGLSHLLDNLLPDFDASPDTDVTGPGLLSNLLGWLYFGRLPALIVLILLLTSFGISGLILQQICHSLSNTMLPNWLAGGLALFAAIPVTRAIARVLAKTLMKDESQAISAADFTGQLATITLGEAAPGSPAEARFRDQYGTTHYLMVEPEDDDIFRQGDQVILLEREGHAFKAMRPDHLHTIK